MAEITCVVVTPEATALETRARFVVLPLYDGELGVAVHHAPLIGRLGAGELRLTLPQGEVQRYFISGGFVQVVDNVVSVMTNQALPAAQLEANALRQKLATALNQPARGEQEHQARDRAVRVARAQLRVAERVV